MLPPESVQRQYQLYDEFDAASTQDEQAPLMREILAITADDFLRHWSHIPDPDHHIRPWIKVR